VGHVVGQQNQQECYAGAEHGNLAHRMSKLLISFQASVSEIGCPGHMAHSCGQVPATCRLSILDILEHETTKYTPNDLLLLFIKDLYMIVFLVGK
jgi:hypothetical protein